MSFPNHIIQAGPAAPTQATRNSTAKQPDPLNRVQPKDLVKLREREMAMVNTSLNLD